MGPGGTDPAGHSARYGSASLCSWGMQLSQNPAKVMPDRAAAMRAASVTFLRGAISGLRAAM